MMSLGNDYHFKIYTEGKTYEFDLHLSKSDTNRYSIIPTNESDTQTINTLLQQALKENPSSIEEISRKLKHIPSITHVSTCPISKSHMMGVQSLQSPDSNAAEKAMLMDLRLQKYCTQRGFQGSILVMEKGNILLKKGYGLTKEKGSPPNENTCFPIGSLTKPITAMAIQDLLNAGKFGPIHELGEIKITDFLPEDYLPTNSKTLESWKTVSLLDLLNHTSGLPEFDQFGKEIMEAKQGQISKPIHPNQVLGLVREYRIKGGSNYCYSNFGYHLLGKMIEHVTEEPFEKYINAFLTNKGLENSGYVNSQTIFPTPMHWAGSKAVDIDPSQLDPPSEAYSSGGIYSTIEDLYHLFKEIQPTTSPKLAGHAESHHKDFRPNYACHLGWNYSTHSEQPEIWKNGAVGGFGSLMISYPKSQSGIIVLSNQPADLERFIGRDLSEILTADTAKAAREKHVAKTKGMLIQNKALAAESKPRDLQYKKAVAEGCWKKFVESGSQKDHGPLKHFLASFYPDPLFIQSEFEAAITNESGFERFSALFEPLPVDLVKGIHANEGLDVESTP